MPSKIPPRSSVCPRFNDSSLLPPPPLFPEKRPQHLGTFIGTYAFHHLHPMVQPGILAQLIQRPHRPGFGIRAAIDQPGDAGVDDRSGTHRAWLQRDIQRAIEQPPVADRLAGQSQGNDLGVGGWIVIGFTAIVPLADDSAAGVMHDHAADRDFAKVMRFARFGQSQAHGG